MTPLHFTLPTNNVSDRLGIHATQFAIQGSSYYLDKGKWLAIDPLKNKEGRVQSASAYPNGRYNVTLIVVGESDGKATGSWRAFAIVQPFSIQGATKTY